MSCLDGTQGHTHPAALLGAYWLEPARDDHGTCPRCPGRGRAGSGRFLFVVRLVMAGLAAVTVLAALAAALAGAPR
ncbi:hypothetical protein GPZ77_01900 [Streptomyces sp. QHH-9511]|uniref:hypothetical protein n=1 Tax=Streptomyces sp. QHH-9511 TaxID=2684468 RepID=UPI0013189F9C|nr:hypothetical protein [Streptomyces sp. QHH-9511]QGZ47324.1 hypothetical protein GPZ77_01900 [Streptomyces sp. QHH-9511]